LGRYLYKLKEKPSLRLQYPGSVAYEGSEQLLHLGLLKEGEQWRLIRTNPPDKAKARIRGDL